MAHPMYKRPLKGKALEAETDHAQAVQDLDRLTEATPVLAQLEKVLKKAGFEIALDFGHGDLTEIRGELTTPAGIKCLHANVKVHWKDRSVRFHGSRVREHVMVITVDGFNFKPIVYDRSNKVGDFNYSKIVEAVRAATKIDEDATIRRRFKEGNQAAANLLSERVNTGGLSSGVRIIPDETQTGAVRVRLDLNRLMPVDKAEEVIDRLIASGAFKVLNGD